APAAAATPEPVAEIADQLAAEEPPRRRAGRRAMRWLVAGGGALAAGGVLALAAVHTDPDLGPCRLRPCPRRSPGGSPALERAAAVSLAAGAVATAAGLLLIARPEPPRPRRWRMAAEPTGASIRITVTRDF
ncbi:MAG TPA: hypothetical protein VKZ63_09595, partial [Kofleriaceae bacterium]|nr:hypothetical protein [Kofleriaceae bacterium]